VLPGTELLVSRLSFGTASLHHLPTRGRRQALLAEAAALGFSHFDASPYYGFGVAEHELGVFLRGRGDAITVASKVGLYPPGQRRASALLAWSRKAAGRWIPSLSRVVVDWSLRTAERSLESSLRTLGRDCVDLLLLHEPAPGLLDTEEFLLWLTRQRRAGKIQHWGLAGPLRLFAAWANHPLAEVLRVPDVGAEPRRRGPEPQLTCRALSPARSHRRHHGDQAALAESHGSRRLVAPAGITRLARAMK
jgi:aryl-alcohol dehydrogenase-like predicted oxidoreductase